MKINNISCHNFKSFEDLNLKLENLNVIIGLNGSGKSSFIMMFKIIKNIMDSSFAQAVINEGGAYGLQNFYMPTESDTTKLGFGISFNKEIIINSAISNTKFYLMEIHDETEWYCGKENDKFVVKNEEFEVVLKDCCKGNIIKIFAVRNCNRYSFTFTGDVENFFPQFKTFVNKEYFNSDTIIHFMFEDVFGYSLRSSSECKVSIYEFEQELLAEFRDYESYSNDDSSHEIFFTMLENILSDEEKKRSFFNFLNYVLPDIDDIEFERKNGSFNASIKEKYSNKYIPANKLSDGTIFLIVIIIVLYYDNRSVTIFDEPERRIHPHLISKVIDMMKDVAERKQLILSTHNAEIVRNVNPSNIFSIKKDKNGNSIISKPAESKEYKAFKDNDIGLDELFIQNLL